MNYVPLQDFVILKIEEESTQTESGITLTASLETETPTVGEIVAVGDKVKDLQVGEKVLYKQYAFELIVGEKLLLIGKEEGIAARITG